MRLSREDIRIFKREGYLILRGVLDPEGMARARDRLWDDPPPSLKRDDPDTWIGPVKEEEVSEDRQNYKKGFRWQYRAPGGEEWMVRLLAGDASLWSMAGQLLGEEKLTLVQPDRIRGIYCTLPYGDAPEPPPRCHVDAHPFHLGAVGYIDDVPPGGGGFAVWPGSHRLFYHAFHARYNMEPTEEYEPLRRRLSEQSPVDCHGSAGDVVFWHHRIGHTAGVNRSRRIRQAVLCDYTKIDIEQTRREPPCEDMWQDWSEEVRRADAD